MLGTAETLITGLAPVAIQARPVRELAPEDFAARRESDTPVSAPTKLKTFKHRHHALARALASGVSNEEAAVMCSYEVGTVRVYMGDPAFKELVAFYQQNAKVQAADLSTRMSQLAIQAAEEILRRVEEEPEEISIGMLNDIAVKFADRTGHAPAMKSTLNVNINVADRLDAARKRVAAQRAMIDITPEAAE